MQIKNNQQRKELEKRLKDSFPEQWNNLSEPEKSKVVDKFYKHAYLERISVKETIKESRDKSFDFGIVLIGVTLAIVTGLVINILHEYFSTFKEYYWIGVVVVFGLLVWLMDRMFEDAINRVYRGGRFLDELLAEDN